MGYGTKREGAIKTQVKQDMYMPPHTQKVGQTNEKLDNYMCS